MDWLNEWERLSQNSEGPTQKNEKGWAKTRNVRLKKGKDWLSKWEGQSQNTEGSTQPKKTRQQLDQNTEDLA